jgi:hypothetical protein
VLKRCESILSLRPLNSRLARFFNAVTDALNEKPVLNNSCISMALSQPQPVNKNLLFAVFSVK